jgi:hypothetical protein
MDPQIILYNPHVDDFLAEPLHFKFLRRRALKKYGFIITTLLNHQGFIPVIIDGTLSSLIPDRYFGILPSFLRNLISNLEYKYWIRINKFSAFKRISPLSIDLETHTLLAFSYKATTGNFLLRLKLLRRFKHVVFHLSHYFVRTAEKANNLNQLPNVWLAGDSDISENYYFQTFFDWYKKEFLFLPFAVKAKFLTKTPLSSRDSRSIATGTLHDLRLEQPASAYQDYINCTGFDTYHPIRKEIYMARGEISGQIDSKVSLYRNYSAGFKGLEVLQHVQVTQKTYFAMDIVDIYNNYLFAIVGEEESGFPALGMLEAMACGCVVFANPARLKSMGLVAGKHFLPYDGTLSDLLSALSLAESRSDLESISLQGQLIVKSCFSEQVVGEFWIRTIHSLDKLVS